MSKSYFSLTATFTYRHRFEIHFLFRLDGQSSKSFKLFDLDPFSNLFIMVIVRSWLCKQKVVDFRGCCDVVMVTKLRILFS